MFPNLLRACRRDSLVTATHLLRLFTTAPTLYASIEQQPPNFKKREWNHLLRNPRRGSKPNDGKSVPKPSLDPATRLAISINKRICEAKSPQDIFAIVTLDIENFNEVCCATAISRLARLLDETRDSKSIVQDPAFQMLLGRIQGKGHELPIRNISNILHGLAKLGYRPDDAFLKALCFDLPGKLAKPESTEQNVIMISYGLATLNYMPSKELLESMEKAYVFHKNKLSTVTIVSTLKAFVEFSKAYDHPIIQKTTLDALFNGLMNNLDDLTPMSLARIFEAFHHFKYEPSTSVVAEFWRAILPRIPTTSASHLSHLIRSAAKMKYLPSQPIMEEICSRIPAALNEDTNLASITIPRLYRSLWELYRQHKYIAPPVVFMHLEAAVIDNIGILTAQSLANILFTVSRLPVGPNEQLFLALTDALEKKLDQCRPQDLAKALRGLSLVWCFRKDDNITILANRLISAASAMALEKLDDFDQLSLVDLIYAYGSLEVRVEDPYFDRLRDTVTAHIPALDPKQLGNVAWAFARLGEWDETLFSAISKQAVKTMGNGFSSQAYCKILWSYAELQRIPDAEFMRAMVEQALLTGLARWSARNLVNMAHALTKLSEDETVVKPYLISLFPAIVQEFNRRISVPSLMTELTARNLAAMIWACTVNDVFTSPFHWNTYISAIQDMESNQSTLGHQQYCQIFQAWMLQSTRHPDQVWPMEKELLQRAKFEWLNRLEDRGSSLLELQVYSVLDAMKVEYKQKQLIENGAFMVDAAIEAEKIAIEIDGQSCFIYGTEMVPIISTKLRNELLEAAGWKVMTVPVFTWNQCTTGEERKLLLQRLLEQARLT